MSIRAGPPHVPLILQIPQCLTSMLARSRNRQALFFLLTVINNHATVTSAKLISPSTKMAKRKMDNKSFQDRWEAGYLFTNIKNRPVCLVCGASVAATKEYNIRRHSETKHHEKYKNLYVKQKLQKV